MYIFLQINHGTKKDERSLMEKIRILKCTIVELIRQKDEQDRRVLKTDEESCLDRTEQRKYTLRLRMKIVSLKKK